MRRIPVSVRTGNYPQGSLARLWAGDDDGSLVTSAAFVELPVGSSDQDAEWLEGGWLSGPWLGRARNVGWLETFWLDTWLGGVEMLPVPTPLYEEGLIEVGLSVNDQLGATTTEPPATAEAFVNSSPLRVRQQTVSVASDQVTMSLTYEESGNG